METSYHTFGKILLMLAAYWLSWFLVKKKKVSIVAQRRFWNVLLLVFSLISCLLGVLLAILIDQGISVSWYMEILELHVDAGIFMTVIALFHIFWHFNYYKSIFRKKIINHENTGSIE